MSRRLLYVVNEAGYFLSHRRPLAEAARAAGWDVHVATAPSPAQDRIAAAGFTPHAVPISRAGMRPDQELRAVLALIRLYRRLRPDLVHLVALKAVVLGGLAARIAAVPATVMTVAGLGHVFATGGPLPRRLFRLALRLAVPARARVIVQNGDDFAELAHSPYLSRRLVLIRGSGVDLARFCPTPEPPGPVVVLMAARLLWTKGVGEYVEAAQRLKAQGAGARFLLAGRRRRQSRRGGARKARRVGAGRGGGMARRARRYAGTDGGKPRGLPAKLLWRGRTQGADRGRRRRPSHRHHRHARLPRNRA
jgi:glycosyltransferase involved in cell wall biosynthesis